MVLKVLEEPQQPPPGPQTPTAPVAKLDCRNLLALSSTGKNVAQVHATDIMCKCTDTCRLCVLQVLAHDDTTLGDARSNGSALTTAYHMTKIAWEEVYRGEVYDIPGSAYTPPSVLHPVAEQMGKAEKYFGLPVVQRTGGRQHVPQQTMQTPPSPWMYAKTCFAGGRVFVLTAIQVDRSSRCRQAYACHACESLLLRCGFIRSRLQRRESLGACQAMPT
jgi:hypothetical protein